MKNKEIRIDMNNGLVLKIPKVEIKRIVLPGIVIRNNYFRLVLEMENYMKNLEDIRRKLRTSTTTV